MQIVISRLVAVMLGLVLLCGCSRPPQRTDLRQWGLHGAVHSCTEYMYDAEQDSATGQWVPNTLWAREHLVVLFDSLGRYTQVLYFDIEGNQSGRFVPLRDATGRVQQEQYYGMDNKLMYTTTMTYVSDNEMEFVGTAADGVKMQVGKLYLQDGLLREQRTTMAGNTFTTRLEYDKQDRLTKKTLEGLTGIVQQWFEYTQVDQQGNWTQQLLYQDSLQQPVGIRIREIAYY